MPFLIRSQSLRRRNREAWQQVGLVAGFLAGRHFVGAKDLHYGYWLDGVEPIIRNLPQAQEDYCRFLLDHIPRDAQRVLDVGSGAGSVAAHLVARGQNVDCVSPSSFLNSQARALLGDGARVFETDYEEFRTSTVYDCVLFCESFQYVKMELALQNVSEQLRPTEGLDSRFECHHPLCRTGEAYLPPEFFSARLSSPCGGEVAAALGD